MKYQIFMFTADSHSLPLNALDLVKTYLQALQDRLAQSLQQLDPNTHLQQDTWTRPLGGGGITRIFNGGNIFAKAGVNFSHVSGESLPPSASAHRQELSECRFNALGVSAVIHPENPYVPTAHLNVRFFIAEKANMTPVWWFGGGFDLTPYYGFVADCKHWHQMAKEACLPFGESLYPRFKQWADSYFFIKHRQEARGIGGLFFDDFNEQEFNHSFAFMQSVGNHFMQAYAPIVQKRHMYPFGARETAFQRYRRGRYVEFNLVYDRGTLFGLQSGGRTESILMSLPPEVEWHYHWQPEERSAEAALYTDFLPVQDWLAT